MDTFHELIDAVDEIKEDITDQKYKTLVETIAKLNEKKPSRFVLIKYIHTSIAYPDDGTHCLQTEFKTGIFMITKTELNKAGMTHIPEYVYNAWVRVKVWRVNDSECCFMIENEEL